MRTGDERWKARGYAGVNVALCVAVTALLLQISYVQRDFSTALEQKDSSEWKLNPLMGFHHGFLCGVNQPRVQLAPCPKH